MKEHYFFSRQARSFAMIKLLLHNTLIFTQETYFTFSPNSIKLTGLLLCITQFAASVSTTLRDITTYTKINFDLSFFQEGLLDDSVGINSLSYKINITA